MPQPRKILQLLVHRNSLIALTDQSEVWVLHGLDAFNSGTDGQRGTWLLLNAALPPVPDAGPTALATPATIGW